MTRTEYLAQLNKYLKRLPEKDYQEAMDYFNEYFEEAGPEGEAAVMADLGSPKEAAHELLTNLLNRRIEEEGQEAKKNSDTLKIVLLTIFAAPIAAPLALVAIVLLFVFFLLLCLLLATLAVGSLAFLVTGIGTIWSSLTTALGISLSTFLMVLGVGIFFLGLAGLMFLAIKPAANFIKFLFLSLSLKLTKRGNQYD
ncbi:DUF1700 domain-containing protein [Streptococcus oricebi]|uniref:DUF1700 domain-containing protein n=1 Tax=Streptococcus oricebi TaxID=1547447 RepID=A0ABS5B5Q4_9STRE|nr:DUF1700 domain-containing protein [Streptococcus oricebi]MBP2624166.1 hypothetical protein [Streptococcus oricebi]